MSNVILFDAVIAEFLTSPAGPVGLHIAARAERVRQQAERNASGLVVGVDTGDLLAGLKVDMEGTPEGPVASVGSDAEHRQYPYPAIVHRTGGQPGGWLTDALRDEFGG